MRSFGEISHKWRLYMEYVLIVEDNAQDANILKEALSEQYKVKICTSQKAAMEILDHKIPSIIIVENKEPEISVVKLFEYLKNVEAMSKVSVIAISNEINEDYERRCLRIGVVDFIYRPFSKVCIASRVARAVEMAQLKRQLRSVDFQKNLMADEMQNLGQKDPLTKLWNRVYTEEKVNEYLKERRNHGALLMIDMDNFKNINDTYGHIVGDELLIEFGRTLKALTRENDIICRLGGDEFVVFLMDITNPADVAEKAEQLIVTLQKRVLLPDGKSGVKASIGIALAPLDGRSFNQLYQNADKSLYYVKQNGKGSYHFYNEESHIDGRNIKTKSTQVDLDHLRMFIQEMGYKKGAYQVEYDGFKKIYRFVARCIGRTGQSVQTVLFSLVYKDGRVPDVQELTFAMDNLRKAVHESIRRGDVATNYSNSQFVVILMDSTIEDGSMVAKRIEEKFEELHQYSPDIDLVYDIQTVNSAPTSDDF